MPSSGRPGLVRAASAALLVQMKNPELPAGFSCIHSATSSKFLYSLALAITPTGWPVQEMICFASSNFQVSSAPLTGLKSALSKGFQPSSAPVIFAVGESALTISKEQK